MFVKISKPGNTPTTNNTGSSSTIMDYLSKENEEKEAGEKLEKFFNNDRDDIYKHEAISIIDDANKQGLKAKDSKFFMLTINPSERELKHLRDIASGHKKITQNKDGSSTVNKTNKPEKDISELSSKERENFDRMLKDYTNNVMDAYARNFDKDVTVNDLTYVAKLEEKREWGYKDKKVLENRDIEKELVSVRKMITDLKKGRSVENLIEDLSSQKHKFNGEDIGKNTFSNEDLDLNKLRLREKVEIKEQLEKDKNNYELKQKDWDLNEQIKWTDGGKIVSPFVVKQNKEIDKKIAILNKGKNGVFSKDPVSSLEKYLKERSNEKHKDQEGNEVRAGLEKKGMQQHVHVVVHRKTKDGKFISPMAKSKGHEQVDEKGVSRKIGFNHEQFKVAANEIFNEKFAYKSNEKEQYSPKEKPILNHDKVKGKIKGKIKGEVNKKVNEIMGKEYAQAKNNTQKTIKAGKAIAKVVMSANPTQAVVNISNEVKKKLQMDLKQKVKEIAAGKALGS